MMLVVSLTKIIKFSENQCCKKIRAILFTEQTELIKWYFLYTVKTKQKKIFGLQVVYYYNRFGTHKLMKKKQKTLFSLWYN